MQKTPKTQVNDQPSNGADLDRYMAMDLLRFTTAGSVDDGKSTLIGRLLLDSKAIFEDQLEAVERASRQRGDPYVDLALLTDGLRAEREQGITIDVAYRYFATPRRKFIIADTPGHIQYTRNMVTGASTAELAIILIDARNGVVTQSKRHGFLASLLQIPHILVTVNKMDLVDYDERVYERIVAEYTEFATKLSVQDMTFIPISALNGDNVVHKSEKMPWYDGPTPAAPPGERQHRRHPQPGRLPLPGADGRAPAPGLPRLCRPDRVGHALARRGGRRAALRPHQPSTLHPHLRRRTGRGGRRRLRHAHAGG